MLYYIGTVTFGLSEKAFWRMTPRKLRALCDVHVSVNSHSAKDGREQVPARKYIDEIIF